MPDNVDYTPGIGVKIASREVSYSGETAQAQAVGLVSVTGPDDAKVATDVGADNPLPVDTAPQGAMAMALSRIAQFLLAPLGYRKDTQRYQVSALIESGTVTTVSTVTTVTTASSLTNFGTLSSERLVLNQNLAAWAAVHRSRIT